MQAIFTPVLALTVISTTSLAVGAKCASAIAGDIVLRKGWQTMMGIMIPVYIINATYLGPVAIYIYYRFGRPAKPTRSVPAPEKETKDIEAQSISPSDSSTKSPDDEIPAGGHCCHGGGSSQAPAPAEKHLAEATAEESVGKSHCHAKQAAHDIQDTTNTHDAEAKKPAMSHCHAANFKAEAQTEPAAVDDDADAGHCCNPAARPFWATVTAGVFHCGAGCVLGDLVGEWLVYGTNARINGANIWVELLVDYAFALLFGVGFQYFSIAPMSGVWGPITVWRAVKADVASLTSFQFGLFAWMIVYQVGIWDYRLMTNTWTYWWQMQVGMCIGVLTAWPANWFLIKMKVKEPCC